MNGFNLSEASDIKLGSSTITALYLGSSKLWPTIDYSQEYLTIESLADNNTISFNKQGSAETKTIYWSSDKTTWNSVSSDSGTLKTLSNNEKIYIKGSNNSYASSTSVYNYFNSDYEFNISGNIMSLIYGDNFIGQTTLPSASYILSSIFRSSTVVDASNLILPATTLAYYCYGYMFGGCTSLTASPELPATTLADSCYRNMFRGCTSLTASPELPATTLAGYCYGYMFRECTSLTAAPELSATTLATACYAFMFYGCTSLTTAPELPATTLANNCYSNMFYGCTSLTTAPELPATTLTNRCYDCMFYDCTNLNSIKCLASDISASNCTSDWVSNVAASGTFTKAASMTSWPSGASGIPSGWTIVNI